MPEVFINYRTGDAEQTAAAIDTALVRRFGEDRVFFAGRSLRAGRVFPNGLLRGVRRSEVLLAVLGAEGARSPRLAAADDWVRRELLVARECGIPVVPVLVGRTTDRLRAADLPPELAWLADVQSLRYDTHSKDRDLAAIGDAVTELVPTLPQPEPAAESESESESAAGPGATSNTADAPRGRIVQARDIIGPMHLGKGDITHNAPRLDGDGAVFVAGDNRGGIRQRFAPRRPADDGRERRDGERRDGER